MNWKKKLGWFLLSLCASSIFGLVAICNGLSLGTALIVFGGVMAFLAVLCTGVYLVI
jgi:hypothetical protein